MSTVSLSRRIAALERRVLAQTETTEIIILGGLPGSETAPIANILPSGNELYASDNESSHAFERRARTTAQEQKAAFLIFGGFSTQQTFTGAKPE